MNIEDIRKLTAHAFPVGKHSMAERTEDEQFAFRQLKEMGPWFVKFLLEKLDEIPHEQHVQSNWPQQKPKLTTGGHTYYVDDDDDYDPRS